MNQLIEKLQQISDNLTIRIEETKLRIEISNELNDHSDILIEKLKFLNNKNKK